MICTLTTTLKNVVLKCNFQLIYIVSLKKIKNVVGNFETPNSRHKFRILVWESCVKFIKLDGGMNVVQRKPLYSIEKV